MGELVEKLIEELSHENMKSLVREVAEKVDLEETLCMPSSSSGKYHSGLTNGENGLFNHTMIGVLAAKRMARAYALDNHDAEVLTAAMILHDMLKYRLWNTETRSLCEFEEHTLKDHADDASRFLQDVVAHDYKTVRDSTYILIMARIVGEHMGRWSKGADDWYGWDESRLSRIAHLADMVASDNALIDFIADLGAKRG